jgi:signal recognition particle receptor subunit beta
MVQINFARKEINCKLVYYGPGMSGKTTNLEMVHKRTPEAHKGELTSISTDGDRTLFFDFMPLDLGEIAGMKTKFHLYTVPGQIYYDSTRKLVLNGADGVIFVADSSAAKMAENLESLENLRENLAEMGKDFAKFPIVIQWNKRDMPDALPVADLEQQINPMGFPTFEAIASKGEGVFQTLKALSAKVLASINSTERIGLAGPALGGNRGAPQSPAPGGGASEVAQHRSGNGLRIERNEIGSAPGDHDKARAPARAPQPAMAAGRPPVASSPLDEVAALPRSPAPPAPVRAPSPAPAAQRPAAAVATPPRAPAPQAGPSPDVAIAQHVSRRGLAARHPSGGGSGSHPSRSGGNSMQNSRSGAATVPHSSRAGGANDSSSRGGSTRTTAFAAGPRVIGAPKRVESSGSLKAMLGFGLLVALAAGAATWFFLR